MLTRRRRLLAVVLAPVVVAAVASCSSSRQVPVVVDPACPPLLSNSSDATDDYGDTVQWQGETWWRTEGRTTADTEQLGVVGCTISDMPNDRGWRVVQQGWPDGTATVLPRGTTLHDPREDRAERALVATTAEGDLLYCLDDDEPGPPTC